jgi:hypothetical protein
MPLDIQSYYEVTRSRVLITRKFCKKVSEKQELLDKKGKLLVRIVKKGNVNDLKEILQENIMSIRYDNDFCLIFSCMNGYYHLVKVLVQYGYLNLNSVNIYEIFAYSIEWSAKMGHLKILQFLLDTLKDFNQFNSNVKSLLEKISLRNYNYDTNYSSLLDDNQVNIKKSRETIKINNEFNKFNNRNRNANITLFNEMLIDASNDYDNEIGVDYNEIELDRDEQDEDFDEKDEQDEDFHEKDDEYIEEDDLFGEESEIDEIEVNDEVNDEVNKVNDEVIKKTKKKVYNSSCFKTVKKNNFYLDGKKSDKSKRMEVILWLLSQEYIINTNYYFISKYVVKYNIINIINILKKHNKFIFEVGDLEVEKINIY